MILKFNGAFIAFISTAIHENPKQNKAHDVQVTSFYKKRRNLQVSQNTEVSWGLIFTNHYLFVWKHNILTKAHPFHSALLRTKDASQGLKVEFPLKLVWRSPYD